MIIDWCPGGRQKPGDSQATLTALLGLGFPFSTKGVLMSLKAHAARKGQQGH